MASSQNSNYYIQPDSLTITPNLYDNPRLVGVMLLASTRIYVDASKYSFLASSSWTLTGNDTILNGEFSSSIVYIYAQLNLNSSIASITFSNKAYETAITRPTITNEDGTTSSASYALVLLGSLSAPNSNNQRTLTLDTGSYSNHGGSSSSNYATTAGHAQTATTATTAQSATSAQTAAHASTADESTHASTADEATHSLSSEAALESNHSLESDHATSAADLDASKQQELDNKYLRKDQDDTTTHKLTAKELETTDDVTVGGSAHVNGDASIGGSTDVTDDITVGGNADIVGDTNIGGDATVEGSTSLQTTTFGTPVNAPVSGTTGGAIITNEGDIKAKSLALSEFLEVPELRFNRASIIVGTNIQSPCGGVIKTVTPIDEYTGIATLELGDDDIAGSIATGDLCWGYWHDYNNKSNNATADSDDRKGNIQYSGFASVYFHISKVLTSADGDYPNNSTVFQYELKEGSTLHPYVGMHFGGRGSTMDKTRQGFTITTPNYTATYQLVSSWDWSDVAKYIVRVSGLLDGFEALANVAAGTWHNYYGTIDCNLWLRGNPNYVSASKYYIYITQSSNGMLEEGETETISIVVRNNWFQNHTSLFSIKVGDNAYSNIEDELILSFGYSDLTEELTRIPVVATYGATTLKGTITIRRLAPTNYSMDISIAGDSLLALGETKKVAFRLLTNTGFDVTSQAWKWLIERGSFDTSGEWTQTDADKVWGARAKARAFNQQSYTSDVYIMLTWSDNPTENDLDPDINVSATTFRITATIGEEEIQETIEI